MSRAEPMNADAREAVYLRDRTEPTAAQRRRMRHKENAERSDRARLRTPRYARLRRRFDEADRKQVIGTARQMVAMIRDRKVRQNYSPKPWSKRQQNRVRRSS